MLEKTSRRTFLDEVFIQNAESFWQTSPTLTFPLSFTVGDGSYYHSVPSRFTPSTSAPSSSISDVSPGDILAQLQRMDARLDTLSTKLYQANASVDRIARRLAIMGDFTSEASPPPPSVTSDFDSKDEDDDDGNDNDASDDDDRYASSTNEMST